MTKNFEVDTYQLSHDGNEVRFFEIYKNGDVFHKKQTDKAFLAILQPLVGCIEIEGFDVVGNPDEKAKVILSSLGAKYFTKGAGWL